jgi:hypothetical protein
VSTRSSALHSNIQTDARPRPLTHLRLDQHEVDEQHHEIMLDVFIRELVAPRALRQPHAFAERPVVRFRVFRVQCFHRVPAFDAYGHCIARGARGGGAGEGVAWVWVWVWTCCEVLELGSGARSLDVGVVGSRS